MPTLTRDAPAEDAFAMLRRLIEPRPQVSGREARRRARYTALCFVLLVPLGIVALTITLVVPDPTASAIERVVMLGGLVLLLALYPMSRGPRYALASHVAIGTVSLGIWIPWLANGGIDVEILYFACIPIIMGGLLVGPMSAAVFALGNVAAAFGIAPILVLSVGVHAAAAFTIPFFLLFVGGFAVNAAHLRERDLREVEDLARELAAHERRRVAMLNNIAHDLGSPVTPLKLQLALVPSDKPLAPERLLVLKRNTAQLERLVGDIKDLARAESGEFRLQTRPLDVAELARSAVLSFQAEAQRRSVALTVDAPEGLESAGDAERLTQVLYNLVTNALKFTPSGGQVTLRATSIGGVVRLSVSDTGRGLARGEKEKLFQPFTQVHAREEIAERGTGLGLYIARSIARAHGGDLAVESAGRGHGSTFTLTLPRRA